MSEFGIFKDDFTHIYNFFDIKFRFHIIEYQMIQPFLFFQDTPVKQISTDFWFFDNNNAQQHCLCQPQ